MIKSKAASDALRRVRAKVKDGTELALHAADRLLQRIDAEGVNASMREQIEALRRGLKYAEDEIEGSGYLGVTDPQLERLAARLRDRIAQLDARIAAAKPH